MHLPPGEVHVWLACLDGMEGCRTGFEHILSVDELERARQFRFELDRSRFVKSIGVLRSILGQYLQVNPKRITFGREKYNKPVLSGPLDRDGIHFNMSRSKGVALYAFSKNHILGIDVEKKDALPDLDWMVRHFFAPCEIHEYFTLPVMARTDAFFRCWTRKEAFLKATGVGLFRPLSSFSVSLRREEPCRIKDIFDERETATEWIARDVPVSGGYAAAIVVDTPTCFIHCGHWLEDPQNELSVSRAGDRASTQGA